MHCYYCSKSSFPKKKFELVTEIAKICPNFNFRIVSKEPERKRLEEAMLKALNLNICEVFSFVVVSDNLKLRLIRANKQEY